MNYDSTKIENFINDIDISEKLGKIIRFFDVSYALNFKKNQKIWKLISILWNTQSLILMTPRFFSSWFLPMIPISQLIIAGLSYYFLLFFGYWPSFSYYFMIMIFSLELFCIRQYHYALFYLYFIYHA